MATIQGGTTSGPVRPPDALRLKAVDSDDLAVISAQIQDAILPVHDMAWDKPSQRFAMVVNRFCWERPPGESEGRTVWYRTLAGLRIEGVLGVRQRGFDPVRDRGRMLSILALRPHPDGGLAIDFAGDGPHRPAVRLSVGAIEVVLEDRGEPWPTLWHPHHPEDDADRPGS
jgi:hypothetical protein